MAAKTIMILHSKSASPFASVYRQGLVTGGLILSHPSSPTSVG